MWGVILYWCQEEINSQRRKEIKIMRVTKIIREYVEKTINAKLVYGEPYREVPRG